MRKFHYLILSLFMPGLMLSLTACGSGKSGDIANAKIGTCDPENAQGFDCECLSAKLAADENAGMDALLTDLSKTRRKHVDKKIPDMTQADINALIALSQQTQQDCGF